MKAIKKFLAAALTLTCLCVVTAHSQEYAVDKGSVNVGGMLSFQSAGGDLYEDDGNRLSTFSLTPQVRYFIVSNFAPGLDLAYTRWSQGGVSSSALAIGPTFTYFIGHRNTRAYPYFGSAFLYLRGTFDSGTYRSTRSGTDFRLFVGVANMVSREVALVMEFDYDIESLKFDSISESGDIIAVSIGIGAFIY